MVAFEPLRVVERDGGPVHVTGLSGRQSPELPSRIRRVMLAAR